MSLRNWCNSYSSPAQELRQDFKTRVIDHTSCSFLKGFTHFSASQLSQWFWYDTAHEKHLICKSVRIYIWYLANIFGENTFLTVFSGKVTIEDEHISIIGTHSANIFHNFARTSAGIIISIRYINNNRGKAVHSGLLISQFR